MNQYDKIVKDYIHTRSEGFNPNKHIEMPTMFRLTGTIKNKIILDLGCGFGEHTKYYSKKGGKVIGIDNSKKEIEYASSLKIKNARFQIHNIKKKLPFQNKSFDLITCSLVLDHIKELENVFKECFRVLKTGGVMIFSIPNPVFYQEEHLAGIDKPNKKVFGDYFRKRTIIHKWHGELEISSYHQPLHNYFSAFLKAGFKLIKFEEPQPTLQSKKFISLGYEFTSKNPYFLFFKIKKD